MLAVAASAGCGASPPPAERPRPADFPALERTFDARLGVYAIDTGSGREIAYNADERFAFASTFKALAAGAILRKYGLGGLDRVIRYTSADLATHAPVTSRHVGTGLSLRALCDAALRFSDNTAANLLLDRLGGPTGLDAILARLGDDVTRMDRREPELNDWKPGAVRDTTTPRAIARDLRAFALGDALRPPERAQLVRWMRANTTGATLIRAGVPDGWIVADRTGRGGTYATRNDIAVVWPPKAAPLVLAIMSNRHAEADEPDDALIARAAAIVARALSDR